MLRLENWSGVKDLRTETCYDCIQVVEPKLNVWTSFSKTEVAPLFSLEANVTSSGAIVLLHLPPVPLSALQQQTASVEWRVFALIQTFKTNAI